MEPIESADELLELLEALETGVITVQTAADQFQALVEKYGGLDFAFESSPGLRELFAELHRRDSQQFPLLEAPQLDPHRHAGGGKEELAHAAAGYADAIDRYGWQKTPFHLSYNFLLTTEMLARQLLLYCGERPHAELTIGAPRGDSVDWRVSGATPARVWNREALDEWFTWLHQAPIPEGEGRYTGAGLVDAGAYG